MLNLRPGLHFIPVFFTHYRIILHNPEEVFIFLSAFRFFVQNKQQCRYAFMH